MYRRGTRILFLVGFYTAVTKTVGIRSFLRSVFHPQTDGLIETFHTFLEAYLRDYVIYPQDCGNKRLQSSRTCITILFTLASEYLPYTTTMISTQCVIDPKHSNEQVTQGWQ